MKDRMVLRPDNHVQIARRAAVHPGVALPGNPDALPVASSGLDPHLERLRAFHRSFPMTRRARRNILPRSVAARTLHVDLHAPAGLLDRPFAMALRAGSWRFDKPRSL